ncbi:hypothetical protein C8J57DRAFT_1235837 [Mycena rebaudengoi]|nr:hypothetical protein C8J57DRAFT_1235837 [Mycena rebaudengoi]
MLCVRRQRAGRAVQGGAAGAPGVKVLIARRRVAGQRRAVAYRSFKGFKGARSVMVSTRPPFCHHDPSMNDSILPAFPPELEREIFEIAATEISESMPQLVGVARRHCVEDWKVGVEGGEDFWPHDIGFRTLTSATEWPKAATEDPFDMGLGRASRISAFFYPLLHFHVLQNHHSALVLHTDPSDRMHTSITRIYYGARSTSTKISAWSRADRIIEILMAYLDTRKPTASCLENLICISSAVLPFPPTRIHKYKMPRSTLQAGDPEKSVSGTDELSGFRRFLSRIGIGKPGVQGNQDLSPSQEITPDFQGWDHSRGFREPRFIRGFRDVDKTKYSPFQSQQASAKVWSIYIAEAERYDAALVESWKADMEGLLIFSGLFSASLTAFLIESYKTLQPDSGNMTLDVLSQISLQLTALAHNTSFTTEPPRTFEPTRAALLCNSLWFFSLALSMTCALLATLVEQWAREFIHKTEIKPSPIRRARIFSFLYFGLRRFGMHKVVDTIPMLLHASLILFFGGLVAFLLPINRLMMYLMGSVLLAFIVLYSTLTILPTISLDCPYRTPLSGFAWNFLQQIRKCWALSSIRPIFSGSRQHRITDAMLNMALESPETRDQRAMIWTMESITDDTELLPFLEAIPEAIHGVKGFHRVNEHLFIPLLDSTDPQLSLSERIINLLNSCRNLDREDPLRERQAIACMKAIWALCMTKSGPQLHAQNEILWFPNPAIEAVWNEPVWPMHYVNSVSAAMMYARFNSIRRWMVTIIEVADSSPDPSASWRSLVQLIVPWADSLGTVYISPAVRGLFESLKVLPSDADPPDQDIPVLRNVLRSLASEETWLVAQVTVAVKFLIKSVGLLHQGGNLPYECFHTCLTIVPAVPARSPEIPPPSQKSHFKDGDILRRFDPTSYPDKKVNELDDLMRCFFRLLPLLHPDDIVPVFSMYLGNRRHVDAVRFATQDCDHQYLVKCLAQWLKFATHKTDILHAIFTLVVLPDFAGDLREWHEWDDLIWASILENHGLNPESPFMSLASVMIQRKLVRLAVEIRSLAASDEERNIERLRALGSDPLLIPDGSSAVPMEGTVGSIGQQMLARIWDNSLTALTAFVSICTNPVPPLGMGHTIHAIDEIARFFGGSFDISLVIKFADSWRALTKRLIQHPDDSQLGYAAHGVLRACSSPSFHTHPSTIPIFVDILALYEGFLETQIPQNTSAVWSLNVFRNWLQNQSDST